MTASGQQFISHLVKTCYLHIGHHKTASSTLQLMLADNEDGLKRHGLCFPYAGGTRDGKRHDVFAMELISGENSKAQTALRQTLDTAGSPARIVISAEALCSGLTNTGVRDRLARFFSDLGYAINVIAYIRPQLLSVNSYFTQSLKMLRAKESFDGFVAQFVRANAYDYLHRYFGLIQDKRFTTSFVPFNSALLHTGICSDFLSRLAIDADRGAFAIPEDQNVSPGPKTIAGLLRIVQVLQEQTITISDDTRLCAASVLRKIAQERGWNTEKFNGLRPPHKKLILGTFSETNDRFARMVWSRPWQDIFGEDEQEAMSRPACIFHWKTAAEAERDEMREFIRMGRRLITHLRLEELNRIKLHLRLDRAGAQAS